MKREPAMKKATKKAIKKAALGMLIVATAFTAPAPAAARAAVKSSQGISWQNEVFTKALYKKTEKIGLGTGGGTVVQDQQTVKKAYRLLADMQLKQNQKAPGAPKEGYVQVTLYLAGGKTKRYQFAGKRMYSAKKTYTIVKNSPLGKLNKIFQAASQEETKGVSRIATASYPKDAPYPDEADYRKSNGEIDYGKYETAYDAWWEDIHARRSITGYADNLDGFLTQSAQQFLTVQGNENRVYSPLNVYMALGMLAELCGGDSRQQILDLLGSKDIASLRRQSSGLWNAQYRNDKAVTSILASSLWLNDSVNFVQPTLDTLAKDYYASAYQGAMGSAELDQALQGWLNEQTGGLLKNQASDIKLDPNTVLALATTLYYRAKWHDEFLQENTKQELFHAEASDVPCDFMHKERADKTYYQGNLFSAVSESLEGSGDMWFLLPNEGLTVGQLLKDSQAMEFLMCPGREGWERQKRCLVNLSVPKFDVSSQFDLGEGLQALGVRDVFDYNVSDFSPMTKEPYPIYLDKASHAGRVKVDETGVVAAAYTVLMMNAGAAMPPEEVVDFVLDRPFLFAVTGSDGLPLFVGVVNHP